MLIGVVLIAAGGVLDVVIPLGSVDHHAHAAFAPRHVAHLVGFAGMALVLAGVVIHGARRQTRRDADSQGGSDTNAHR